MKKIIFLILTIFSINSVVHSQCTVTPLITDSIIDCGDSTMITITGFALSAISDTFSGIGPTDPGWQTTAGAIYTNPYIPSPPILGSGDPDGGTYFWMGATAVLPAALTTVPFNVSNGGQICFDFVYAVQGGAAPTEGPDLSEEGITIQYSPDGGITWIDITYFMPNGQQLPSNPGANFPMTNPPFSNTGTPYTVWNTICIPIPLGALGPNTSFQWIQEFNSGACCDHWGLDNITIQLADPAYTFYENGTAVDTNFLWVSPTDTQGFTITYTNGIDDTCTGTVTVYVNPTLVLDDFFICEGVGTGDTLTLTGVAPWAPVLWTPPAGLDDPSSHTPFASPPSPGPSTTYTLTSACGSDEVTTTFYSVDAVAEKDTICPDEINQLYANVTGVETDCDNDYTGFEIPFSKEFNASPTSASFTNTSNGISPAISIPFPFDFFCTQTSLVRMTVDGYLAMSAAGFPSQSANGTLPNANPPSPIIALMWADLVDSTGLSNYFVNGTAPNRKMVFEYNLVHAGGTTTSAPVIGQIILHETTNFVDILCESCVNAPNNITSTQGIKTSATVGQATPGRNNTTWSASNLAYRYIPNSLSSASQTITWTPSVNVYGANTLAPIVTPDTTTQYIVSVLNNWNLCEYFDTVDVFVELLLTADAGPDTSICFGETYPMLGVSNGDSYTWSPNDGSLTDVNILTPIADPAVTTIYTLEAQAGQCLEYDTMTLTINNFVIDSTTLVDELCVANTGSITIHASGQTAGLQYSIDNGVTYQLSNTFNGLTGGSFDILIGSVNCDTTYTMSILAAASPMVANAIILDPADCGLPGGIFIDVTGGAQPLMYSIDNGVTFALTDSFPSQAGGNYDIVVQDASLCLLDTAVVIPSTNVLDLGVDNTTLVSCFGVSDGSVTFSATGGQAPFQYSLDQITTQAGNAFFNLPAGPYTGFITGNNGCSDSVAFTINEPNLLAVQITVPGNVLCAGGVIDSLTAVFTGGTPDYSYEWNTTATTQTIQGIVFGNYWVQVTDSNLCVANDSVIIAQPVALFLEIASDSVLCGGQNSGFAYVTSLSGGTPGYTYSWEGPAGAVAGNDTASALPAGQYILTVSDFNGCPISDTTIIFEPSPVLIALSPTVLSCNGDNDACIDAAVSGGTPPYLYAWSHGPATEDVCGLSAGWYTFTVTDSKGCVYLDSAQIIQPDSLSLTTTQVDVTCNGFNNGSATVNVTGGTPAYSYDWVGTGQTNATAANIFAGNYTIIVTDANTCINSIAIVITEPTDSITLTIDNVTDVLCNGTSTGAVSVSTFGGTPTYTYLWTNGGGTNEDLSTASAGVYTLTVTDANGCPNSITATIAEPTAIPITLAGTNTSCFGASTGSINATVTGGESPYSYAWSGPNGYTAATEDVNSIAAGTYSLIVTDDNNCTSTQNVVITEPALVSIGFSESPVNCFGGNDGSLTASVITGGTAPFSFQWDAAANNQVTATATGLTEGNYLVSVTDANGCTYSDNANLTEPLVPLSITMDSTNITCASYNDGVGIVTASGGTAGYTYLWNDPIAQTSAQATNLSPGTYQVIVTDANGCAENGTIMITEPDPIFVDQESDSTNCFGDATGAIQIIASGGTMAGFAYSIDGGETFQSSAEFYNLPAGIYNEIIVQDLGSNVECYSDPISSTIYEQPYFSFVINPDDTTLQLEVSLTLDLEVTSPNYTNADIAQVNWFPTTGLNCIDCIDPTVLTYDHYTEYTATVYYYGDDNELCNSASNTVIIVENNLALFIPNAFTPSNFDEVNRRFEVFGEGIEYITLQVFNRIGEKIFESKNQSATWDGTYKGELQSPGVYTYFVSVEYLDGKVVDRKGSVTLLR